MCMMLAAMMMIVVARLEVGMIITVEPGIYISEEADVPAQYKGIGVRIEDNLLMTEYGNKKSDSSGTKRNQMTLKI